MSKTPAGCGIGDVFSPRAVTYSGTCPHWGSIGASASRDLPDDLHVHVQRLARGEPRLVGELRPGLVGQNGYLHDSAGNVAAAGPGSTLWSKTHGVTVNGGTGGSKDLPVLRDIADVLRVNLRGLYDYRLR